MELINFIKKETQISKRKIISMASIAGITGALLLAIVNVAAEQVANKDKEIEIQLFAFYMIFFLIHVGTQRYAQHNAVTAIERALQSVRLRITDKIRHVDLRFVEENSGISSYTALSQSSNMITNSVISLVVVVESVLIFVVTGIYLAWLSPLTMIATFTIIIVAVPLYVNHYHKTTAELDNAGIYESQFFGHFSSILKGFKELKVNQDENNEIYDDMSVFSQKIEEYKISSNLRLLDDLLYSTVTMYLFLMVAVFVIPQFVPEQSSTVYKISATLLFMMGPIGMFASALPNITKTDAAVNSLYRLESKVDKASQKHQDLAREEFLFEFDEIKLDNLTFSYKDKDENSIFSSGPIDFTLSPGELVFIIGGNGSGKSTFLKLLTGLYYPESGVIYLDGNFIDQQNYPAYRSLFSLVFTDFHLFERVYGLDDIDPKEINYWLTEMGLNNKTRFVNGRFTNTDLSTGQRKRLAFIVAVLKNRPICIFDELAADQDPSFRRHFYKFILPNLQAQGRTIIVVTHDEMYFDCCDRLVKLQDGKII